MPGMDGGQRRCAGCGTVLSRFNAGARCSPCQRTPAARVDPAFWHDRIVREAVSAWELGLVVRLFRKHTGLSQAAVARLVNIDQAEVSRLERGLKGVRDRRQLLQWAEALGVPLELTGPLPTARPESQERGYEHRGGDGGVADSTGYLALSEGPGQLLLPGGRNIATTALPVLALPAVSFHGNGLRLATGRDTDAWSRMPMRALIVASRVVEGMKRHFALDARWGVSERPAGAKVDVPVAYELDDLTYGILWAVAGFDAALLGDDGALHDLLPLTTRAHEGPDTLRDALGQRELTDGSRMLLGSETCARYILSQRDRLGGEPVFWTREQRGEEAATWLFFKHKLDYLRRTAPGRPGSGSGRAFCVPAAAVSTSPSYERVLLFLAMALMESCGIRTWLTDDSSYEQTDGFVLVPGHGAIIATWVRSEGASNVALTARPHTLRSFAEVTAHASHHSVTGSQTPEHRLAATAEYLELDRAWLARRCRQLALEGTARLASPRSRHLSVDGLDAACRYVADQFGAVPAQQIPTR